MYNECNSLASTNEITHRVSHYATVTPTILFHIQRIVLSGTQALARFPYMLFLCGHPFK